LWFSLMNREAFGNFDFDMVQITTAYPGATPEEVEQLVTMPLENVLKNLEGIDEMRSVSVEALSLITLKLDPDVEDTQKTVRDIEREVEMVRTLDLPENGDEPRVLEITAAFPVLTVGVSGDLSEMEIRNVAEKLEDDLLDVEGVSRITKKGFKKREIWIEASLEALRKYQLSLLDLVNSVRDANHTSPGGRLELGGKEILIRTMGKTETVHDLENVVVRSNEEGQGILIRDVAKVLERLERERKYTRFNGDRSIELNVLKKDSGDTLEIDAAVKELVGQYRRKYPALRFGFANEISFYIQRRLDVLIKNGLVGIILVMIIMFLFLKPQSAFWATMAIPFAFLGGLITMHFFGMTINLLSLFAFILVSGMLVDNGIVVSEYIERKREEGIPSFTAVVVGISEMSLPVFAAALTTIIAFAPLAFMAGITGKFLSQMPLVLIACLVSDLIECLFILPGHLYHYDLKIKLPLKIQKIREKAQEGLSWVTAQYFSILKIIIRHSGRTMVIIISLFLVLGLWAKWRLKFQLFPNIVDVFVINYELPIGTTLDQTEKVGIGFEDIVRTLPPGEIDAIVTQVGSQGEGHRRSNSGTNVGEVRVYLNKANTKRIPGDILVETIRSEIEEYSQKSGVVKFELEKVRGGPPTGRSIEVQLIGNQYADLVELANKTKEFLRGIDGTIGISDDFDEGKEEFRMVVDRGAVARAGIKISQVASVIRSAFDGQEATEIKRVGETEDIKVRVKLPEADRKKKETLDQITVTTPRGRQVPLMSLVKLEKGKGLLSITRFEGHRTITVKGEVNPAVITSHSVNDQLDDFLKEILKGYPRVQYQFSGERKTQAESMTSLYKAIFIALALIVIVLAALFQSYWDPFIIISVIPFALIGVFLSLLIPGKPLTLLVLIGFTGLTGVVVNNSILMIETFNRLMDQKKMSFEKAVAQGAKDRLRPILLTSISTFFAVMPLGYGIGGKEPFLQDMAYSFGWGLLFCSLVTLFWIPSFYMTSVKVIRWGRKTFGKEDLDQTAG